jgi:hypothetical protein
VRGSSLKQNINHLQDRNWGPTETLVVAACWETVMKLSLLYLLITTIAMLAHFGAHQPAKSPADEATI